MELEVNPNVNCWICRDDLFGDLLVLSVSPVKISLIGFV